MTYLDEADASDAVERAGPFRLLTHRGRAGVNATSISSRITLPRHTVAGPRGALSLWVLPLEDLHPASPMPHTLEHEPSHLYYPLLGDHPDLRDRDAQRFHLRFSNDWWRNLTAQFWRQNTDCPGYKAIVAPDHFHFVRHRWHHVCVTWDKPASRFRLYVNGVPIARETPFLEMFAEDCGPRLYLGNPTFAFSGIRFYDTEFSDDEASRQYHDQAREEDHDIVDELRRQHVAPPPGTLDWAPDRSWRTPMDLPLNRISDLDHFQLQGQEDCLHVEEQGLRVTTIDDASRQHGLGYNKVEMYLWSRQCFEGDVAMEFDFKLLQPNGLCLAMIHANGMQREDFMSDYPIRTDGSMRMVCWENVRNYHWEFYREIDNCRNDTATHLFVKNPWMRGLAYQVMPAPLEQQTWHRFRLVQEGPRLRGAIDDQLVFDVTDRPDDNNGPVLDFGRVAIRLKYKSSAVFRNLRVHNRPSPIESRPLD